MKPSERLEELHNAMVKERLAEREHGVEPSELPMIGLGCTQKALAQLLDEQHEREQRRREVFRLALSVLAGHLYNKKPGDIDLSTETRPRPELPARVEGLVRELCAYPKRNWSIPEPDDYFEALLRYVEELERERLL
jgi:hypothetical protein